MGCIAILSDASKLAPGILGEEVTQRGCCLAVKLLRWLGTLPTNVSDGIPSLASHTLFKQAKYPNGGKIIEPESNDNGCMQL